MSQQHPDQIRADIEQTRAQLGSDIDAVAEKVTPENVMDRQKNKVRGKWHDVRESMMGSADETGSQVKDSVADAPDVAKAKTRGNPIVSGLVAMGIGWIAASLVPSTKKEQDLVADAADRVQPHVQDAVDSAKEAAQDIADDMKEPAKDAAQSVKDTAQQGVEDVKSHSQSETDRVKNTAQDSAQNVKDETSQA